jgi:hypothetical protein
MTKRKNQVNKVEEKELISVESEGVSEVVEDKIEEEVAVAVAVAVEEEVKVEEEQPEKPKTAENLRADSIIRNLKSKDTGPTEGFDPVLSQGNLIAARFIASSFRRNT